MPGFDITSSVPIEAKKQMLRGSMEQASSEIFRIAMDILVDPETITESWTADSTGYGENHMLRAEAELLEFHLKRFYTAKNKLDQL